MSWEGAWDETRDIVVGAARAWDSVDDAFDDAITWEEAAESVLDELEGIADNFWDLGEEIAEETQPAFDQVADAITNFWENEDIDWDGY